MTTVLQFEFDRGAINMSPRTTGFHDWKPTRAANEVIRNALEDVFKNGGTLVVVVGPQKTTVIQRREVEDFDDEAAIVKKGEGDE